MTQAAHISIPASALTSARGSRGGLACLPLSLSLLPAALPGLLLRSP